MAGRKIPLITNQIYHVVNRGVASQPTFLNQKDYFRFIETFLYYQNQNLPIKYSFFLRLPPSQKTRILDEFRKNKQFLVEIIAYCLMPNHFHLILKQLKENGISAFMANLGNSYTRYFNTRQKRIGPVFQGRFKAVRVETDEQLLHLSRYVHLNPYSSYLVKTISDLYHYPYSSLAEYLNLNEANYCQKDLILHHFRKSSYKDFVSDQANYQRKLQEIKHLTLEK